MEIARPVMERLSKETHATVMVKVREQDETVTIDRVESRHFLRLAYPVGLRLPLNASSSGKVFLAHMSAQERSGLCRTGSFRKLTRRTKTNLSALERDISIVLRKGFAVSDEEHLLGARGIAAPIFAAGGVIEATLAIGLPKVLLPDKMIDQVGSSVRNAAEEISGLFGFSPLRRSDQKNGRSEFIIKGSGNGRNQRR
jgi:DNA-binding IclR family transcriptional regulator